MCVLAAPLTCTIFVWWKWRKNVLSHQCIDGEKWHVTQLCDLRMHRSLLKWSVFDQYVGNENGKKRYFLWVHQQIISLMHRQRKVICYIMMPLVNTLAAYGRGTWEKSLKCFGGRQRNISSMHGWRKVVCYLIYAPWCGPETLTNYFWWKWETNLESIYIEGQGHIFTFDLSSFLGGGGGGSKVPCQGTLVSWNGMF